jgi:hypothetical protein
MKKKNIIKYNLLMNSIFFIELLKKFLFNIFYKLIYHNLFF